MEQQIATAASAAAFERLTSVFRELLAHPHAREADPILDAWRAMNPYGAPDRAIGRMVSMMRAVGWDLLSLAAASSAIQHAVLTAVSRAVRARADAPTVGAAAAAAAVTSCAACTEQILTAMAARTPAEQARVAGLLGTADIGDDYPVVGKADVAILAEIFQRYFLAARTNSLWPTTWMSLRFPLPAAEAIGAAATAVAVAAGVPAPVATPGAGAVCQAPALFGRRLFCWVRTEIERYCRRILPP